MTLQAPGRSGLGFYVQSLLEARGDAGEQPQPPVKPEPYPIPDRQVYCLAGLQAENQAAPSGQCGPTVDPCPDDDPGTLQGNWNSDYVTDQHCVPYALVPRNFPVGNGADSFPAGCENYWLGGNTYPQGSILRNLSFREITSTEGETRLRSCSTGTLGQGPLGFVSLEISTARWNILSINGALNRIYVDSQTYLYATGTGGFQPLISVSGQPKNNGYYRVFQVNETEGWIEVTGGLENEAGFGQVNFQPAISTVCGNSTSVIDACQSIRIYVDTVAGIDKRMHFYFTDGPYADEGPLPITGLGPDYIEVLSQFLGDWIGQWGAGFWTFNERGDRVSGAFTAVTDPPNRFIAEVRNYSGYELSASEPDDTLLRITSSVGYNGDQSVTPAKPFTTPLWRYNNQLYVGPSSGDWQNRAVVLIDAFFLSTKPGRVTGVVGLYDGLYPFVRSAPGGEGGVIVNTPWVGQDSGVIEFQGLSFLVNDMPLGYDQTGATVVIAGTGQYDGTYTGCHVFDTGFGFGVIEEGTLDDVWYQGDVTTGTWEVTTGTPANGTISQSFGDDPDPFSFVQPEKSGSFNDTLCVGIRVNVGSGHGISVDDTFEMFSNAVYTSLCFGTVADVYATEIDIEFITFEGTDSGLWNATE